MPIITQPELSISYRKIWSIAYPIIIGSVAQNIINVTDTAFLGRLGDVALGGGAIGGIFYLAIIMLGWGFGIGTQIVVARRYGEGIFRSIGRTIEHGFFFSIGLALIIFILVRFLSGSLLDIIIQSDAIRNTSFDFLNYRIWGIFFAHTNFIFRAFYVGIGKTRVITFTTLVMVTVNVILDYSLIFGNFGFPEMGVSGAALASVISEFICSVSFIAFTLARIPLKKFRLFSFKVFSIKLFLRLLKVSFPMMLLNFLSFSVWFLFFLIIEKMGEKELAISNIIRSIYIVLMIPIMGFASATNTLVSYVIGQGRPQDVMKTVAKTASVCASGVLLITIFCWIFPETFLSIYTNDRSLIELGIPIVYIISIAAVLLALGNVLFNGVSGTGMTNVSLYIEVMILAIYLIATFILVQHFKVSVGFVWGVEILYGVLLSISSFIYLKSGRWMGKRV